MLARTLVEYSFDVDHAVKYGVDEAIFLKNMIFWIKKNKANNRHFYDGHTWTYNSVKAYSELFPFWTYAKIRGIIDKLIKEGVIMKGNYNSNTYDRTMWYCIIDKSICENQQLHLLELANGSAENDKSYTYNKPDSKPYNNTDNRKKRFSPPSYDDIKKYTDEIQATNIDINQFIDFYTSNGWMVGKNKMKDWQATVRNWERREKKNKPETTEEKNKRAIERLKKKLEEKDGKNTMP